MSTENTLNNPAHDPEDWQEKLLVNSKGPIRFTPKNDYMFKAICQSNTYALEGLLAALLGLQQEEIEELKILNPIQLGATANEKDCVLDVKLRLNNNQIINIEMQVLFHSVYHLTDAKNGHIYTGKFALSVVNLKQINRATKDGIASGLRDWARLFQATTWESSKNRA